MFDKWKNAGSKLVEAGKDIAEGVVEASKDAATAAEGAYEGVKAKANNIKIVNGGTKEITINRQQIDMLLETGDITLDDKATDDGYDVVVIKLGA